MATAINIAESVYAALGTELITADSIIEKVQPYNYNLRFMVMGEDKQHFVVAFDDGSVLQFHFFEDKVKVEVGVDMQYVAKEQILS